MNTIEGGAGSDSFVLYGNNVFDGNFSTINDFDTVENDLFDLSNILEGYDHLTDVINDFVLITEDGNDTVISVDRDGTAPAYNSEQLLVLKDTAGQWTDAQDMVDKGHLVV